MDPMFPNNDDWSASSPKFAPYEQECIDYVESLPDKLETECDNEKLNYERKLSLYFQNSAMAITQLYSRDNNNDWTSFQQASTNVACLYKESSDYHKKIRDLYNQTGYHKRTKEICNWVKKKKSLIRREELLTFLAGQHNNYLYHRFTRNARSNWCVNDDTQLFTLNTSSNSRNNRFFISDLPKNDSSDHISLCNNNNNNDETYKDAFVIGSLVDIHNKPVESRKRTISTMDICMDTPNTNNKRSKFI